VKPLGRRRQLLAETEHVPVEVAHREHMAKIGGSPPEYSVAKPYTSR
jgi:hypothetical protein